MTKSRMFICNIYRGSLLKFAILLVYYSIQRDEKDEEE